MPRLRLHQWRVLRSTLIAVLQGHPCLPLFIISGRVKVSFYFSSFFINISMTLQQLHDLSLFHQFSPVAICCQSFHSFSIVFMISHRASSCFIFFWLFIFSSCSSLSSLSSFSSLCHDSSYLAVFPFVSIITVNSIP